MLVLVNVFFFPIQASDRVHIWFLKSLFIHPVNAYYHFKIFHQSWIPQHRKFRLKFWNLTWQLWKVKSNGIIFPSLLFHFTFVRSSYLNNSPKTFNYSLEFHRIQGMSHSYGVEIYLPELATPKASKSQKLHIGLGKCYRTHYLHTYDSQCCICKRYHLAMQIDMQIITKFF